MFKVARNAKQPLLATCSGDAVTDGAVVKAFNASPDLPAAAPPK